jgi:apolipoprotein N-acyltransferase
MPFAVVALPAGLALFHALGAVVARLLWSGGAVRVLALAVGLGGAEWLRGHILTGFPWNSFGQALADNLVLGQSAALIGVEGLTPLTIAVFATPAVLLGGPFRRRMVAPLLGLATLLALAAYGAVRLAGADDATVPGVALRIVQPNVPQDEKFRPERRDEIMANYLALSNAATGPDRRGIADVTMLVWPESAFPFFLARTPEALAAIADLLPEKTVLLTGAARLEPAPGNARPRVFNAIQMVGSDGSILDSYDKVHLVPFGEFLPFQDWLERLGLMQLTRLPGGFSAGDRPHDLVLPGGLRLAPLICYEAIFPDGTIDPEIRPDALLNVTNDAWFGDTPGPYQHLAQARTRAIEQGLPLIRAANTGVSAIFDAYGKIVAKLPVGTAGTLDAALPKAIPTTIYSRYGQISTLGLYVALLLTIWLSRRQAI